MCYKSQMKQLVVMRKCPLGFVAMMAFSCLAADTFYVATNGVDAVGRGSEESPFETIQYAIDSASSGSTIWVKPGIYDKGGAENAISGAIHTNRVVLKKKVYLKSTDGAAVTHIVGAPDPNTGGVGPGAVRCIVSPDNGAGNGSLGLDSEIVGFTIRDGYGDDGTTGHNHRSGGFLQHHGVKSVYISDCVISNCVSYSHGGARGGTFARCLFVNNRVTAGHHGNDAAGVGNACLVNCLVVDNGDNTYDNAAGDGAILVNCTVVCNRGRGCSSNCTLYNTVVCGNTFDNYPGTKATDCVIGGYPVYSPLDQDYRIVTGSAADGTGNPAHLPAGGKPFSVTTGMVEKDFAGNTVDTTAEHIHVGAIQETMGTATEGGILCLDGAFSCNGHCASVAYAQTTNLLTQWRVNFVGTSVSGSSTNYFRNILRKAGNSSNASVLQVGYDNSLVMMVPPKSGVATTNTAEYGKGMWVDPVLGSDTANDGSEAAPYRTIQKALNEGKRNTIVFLAPGVYAEGGVASEDPAVAPYAATRVWVTNDWVRIVGVAGAERTIIVGAPDPTTGGLGDGAMRCAASTTSYSWLSGVTLSNGWTRTGTGSRGHGAAIDGNLSLTDSIVTDCHGQSSIFHNSRIYRCKVYGNESIDASLFDTSGRVVCSWFGPNKSKSSSYYGYLGTGVEAWFSTLVMEEGKSLFSQSALLYNCLAVNGQYVKSAMKSKGNLFWNFKEVDAAAVGTFTDANPRLRRDMIHVPITSPALTAGVAPSEAGYNASDAISRNWYTYSSTDIEGNLIRFNADGTAMVGALHDPLPVRTAFTFSIR